MKGFGLLGVFFLLSIVHCNEFRPSAKESYLTLSSKKKKEIKEIVITTEEIDEDSKDMLEKKSNVGSNEIKVIYEKEKKEESKPTGACTNYKKCKKVTKCYKQKCRKNCDTYNEDNGENEEEDDENDGYGKDEAKPKKCKKEVKCGDRKCKKCKKCRRQRPVNNYPEYSQYSTGAYGMNAGYGIYNGYGMFGGLNGYY